MNENDHGLPFVKGLVKAVRIRIDPNLHQSKSLINMIHLVNWNRRGMVWNVVYQSKSNTANVFFMMMRDLLCATGGNELLLFQK